MMLHLGLYGVLGFHYGFIYDSEMKNVSWALGWDTGLQLGRGVISNYTRLTTKHIFIRMNGWRKVGEGFSEGSPFLKDSGHLVIHLMHSKYSPLYPRLKKKKSEKLQHLQKFQSDSSLNYWYFITQYIYFVF